MAKFVYKNEESMNKIHAFYDKALASLNVDYDDFYIQTSFGKTHILVVGDKSKKPIFTLHGGNGISPLNIRFFLPLLDKYYIIAPDVIGMPGKSEPHRNLSTKKDDYADWICEVLDEMKIDKIMFVVSSYSSAMTLSLAKVRPERISKAVLLVPSGIAHGPLLPIMWSMSIPFIKYYFRPSKKAMDRIMNIMSSDSDEIWYEFFDLMMSGYKMEMRTPKFFTEEELIRFASPVFVIASTDDIFFPADEVLPKADTVFSGEVHKMEIPGKHLPSPSVMADVCKAIVDFDSE